MSPITFDQFSKAITACGFPRPDFNIYNHFEQSVRDFSREELVMFLAQLIHESSGFQHTEELCYANRPHHNDYRDEYSLPGRDYHGRGWIQLTWAENYKEASEALGLDDQLLREPHLVSESYDLASKVSVWYWKAKVRPVIDLRKFGTTTMAINGAIECSGGFNYYAHRRYKLYLIVADVLGIANPASERGCYN